MKKKILLIIFLSLVFFAQAFAQNHTVTGVVTAKDDGLPIQGVTVKVKGTDIGVATNGTGNYRISVPDGAYLQFIAIGYYAVTLPAKGNVVNVSLSVLTSQLNEIVITGYQTQKLSNNLGAISPVDGKELADKPVQSVDNLLAGKVPGVQITSQNGDPNGNAFIRIRGTGSINASDEPLLVIDGIQIPDNDVSSFYNGLNPNDISSINVLKDAAGAALYGARGSNGVIVITTKKGSANNNHVSYLFQYGINKIIPDNFKLMDATQKLQYEYDLGYTDGNLASLLQTEGLNPDVTMITPTQRQAAWNVLIGQGHNWEDDILHTGHIQQHQVTVSGGTDATQYYISFQKYDEDGLTRPSDVDKWGGKVNLTTKINSWATFSENASLDQKGTNVLRDRFNVQSPFVAMYTYNPYEPVYNPNGSYNLTSQGLNILEELKNVPQYDKYLTGFSNSTIDIHPITGLDISSSMGLVLNQYTDQYFIEPGSELDGYTGDPTAPGLKQDDGSQDFNYDWINKAQYDFKIANDHHFTALGVEEFQQDEYTSYSLESKGFPDPDLNTQDGAAANTGKNTTTYSAYTLFSLLGKLDYDYKGKYFASGSFRRDGSSRFGVDNLYGNFYAVSAGWLITSEDFAKNIDWLNSLRLRGSIGTTGNFSGIGNYQALGLFSFGQYDGLSAASPSQIANPNLTWEKKLKRDIGVDFQIFKNITGTVDYYNDNTTALLLNVPISQTTGFSNTYKNAGALINKGIDLQLNADIINRNGIKWSIYGDLDHNVNRVTQLAPGINQIINSNTPLDIIKPGYAINTFYLVRYAGVNPQTGAARFYDANGKITETYSSDDAVILPGKSPDPKLYGGYGTSLSYKGFQVDATFTYQYGGYTYNNEYQTLVSWGGNVGQNQAVQAANFWTKPGQTNVLPKPIANGPDEGYLTDFYLQKDNYVRFKNLTISYTVPKTITQRYKVYNLRVFVQGQNLVTFNPDHFFGDPEVGIGSKDSGLYTPGEQNLFSYPQTRQFTLGVNVTF
jgi:TonB-linked SusC/RagA family outer membrane protein